MSGITPCHGEIVVSIADAYPLVKVRPARRRVSPARGPVPSVALVGGLRGAHGSGGDEGPRDPLSLSRPGADAGSADMDPLLPGRVDGGDEETRTPDPLLAKEMLFQLSYVPRPGWWATLDSNQ